MGNELQVPKEIPRLETRHYEWMFSVVQEHFVEKIERLELDTIRHERFASHDVYYRTGIQAECSRAEKIKKNAIWIEQYNRIVEFCSAVRIFVMEKSAEEFAEQIGPILNRAREEYEQQRNKKQ